VFAEIFDLSQILGETERWCVMRLSVSEHRPEAFVHLVIVEPDIDTVRWVNEYFVVCPLTVYCRVGIVHAYFSARIDSLESFCGCCEIVYRKVHCPEFGQRLNSNCRHLGAEQLIVVVPLDTENRGQQSSDSRPGDNSIRRLYRIAFHTAEVSPRPGEAKGETPIRMTWVGFCRIVVVEL